jgi:hypothetical protein
LVSYPKGTRAPTNYTCPGADLQVLPMKAQGTHPEPHHRQVSWSSHIPHSIRYNPVLTPGRSKPRYGCLYRRKILDHRPKTKCSSTF